ncbi:MAG: DUF501 domain-containing protein [Halanaerobiales bacterium]
MQLNTGCLHITRENMLLQIVVETERKVVLKINISREELMTINYQLGRTPENLSGVALYCPFNKPAVLLTLPYSEENGIYPTIYWLSCPYLVREVATIEDQGLVKELSTRLSDDEEFRKDLMAAHRKYAEKRVELISEEMKERIKKSSKDIYKVLVESGVGGIRDKVGVKCLHTHLADFLLTNKNPVGKLVWGLVSWPEDCHICDLENIRDE